jgi:hypothetical protein
MGSIAKDEWEDYRMVGEHIKLVNFVFEVTLDKNDKFSLKFLPVACKF